MATWVDALEPGAPDIVAAWRGIDEGEFISVRREVRKRAGPGSADGIVAQLGTLATALAAFVETAPEEILRAPGGEEDWNVAQAIGHACEARPACASRPRWQQRDASRRMRRRSCPASPARPMRTSHAPAQDRPEPAPDRALGRTVAGHETEPCPLVHPLVGRLRCGEWLLFAGVHDLMHLEQLHDLAGRTQPEGPPA